MAGFAAEAYLRDVLGASHIKRSGDELIHACLLPFGNHANDHKNPAASLNSEKLLYNCFKCSAGGTLIWATEEILGVNSTEARRLIKESFDPTQMSEEQFLQELEQEWDSDVYVAMPRYNLKMLDAWKCYTHYMDSRGITHEVQKEMMTGLYKTNVDDIGGIQVVQPRIVIPHIFGGVLRGWTMRLIDDRQLGTKYKHTGQFPKKTTLYNWDNIRQYDSVIVVESPMSVLKLKSEGIHNVVATFGAEVNPGQIDLLRQVPEVILFPDGDLAGYRALAKVDRRGNVEGIIQELGHRTNLWIVDHGLREDGTFNEKDAANYGVDELRGLLENKVPAMMFGWRDESAIRKVHETKDRGDVLVGQSEDWD